ncbi:ABC transporter substrate-binding protein [Streptococcus pneumoniae]|nr:ABC transporter substrate-binding protein [Streptococcus pneumoniae]VJM83501.1 ABC transporter substrate-binding protein [Streptococcus pneumoniae]VMG73068.1 ABC transporter substrate-binding protein [Streptococcus pneumoniae]VMJ49216.1 ABC transporter substrate-binding protein [Streptococcus pneumoniae]VMX36869.1 ABC transporter substrate-binding protein [Streptococcus pneumoniae]
MRKGTMLSVVAGLSLAILAGCSGGTNSKQASSSNDIKVWVQFSDETNEGKAWQKVVDNFNQSGKSKYKVVTEYIPRSGSGGGYEDKVNAAITTNSLPDVITLDGPNTAAYAKSKVITPLDDYLKDNNMDDVLDSIKQQELIMGNSMHLDFLNRMLVFITIKKCSKRPELRNQSFQR